MPFGWVGPHRTARAVTDGVTKPKPIGGRRPGLPDLRRVRRTRQPPGRLGFASAREVVCRQDPQDPAGERVAEAPLPAAAADLTGALQLLEQAVAEIQGAITRIAALLRCCARPRRRGDLDLPGRRWASVCYGDGSRRGEEVGNALSGRWAAPPGTGRTRLRPARLAA